MNSMCMKSFNFEMTEQGLEAAYADIAAVAAVAAANVVVVVEFIENIIISKADFEIGKTAKSDMLTTAPPTFLASLCWL